MSDSSPARPYYRTPAITPDGQQIAFVYAGDIWLVGVDGGTAERLTAHSSRHWAPRWSPDAKQLAFSSNRTGGGDIYLLPLSDGAVQRVTYHDAPSTIETWSHDGQHLFFSSGREQQGTAIYRTTVQGATPIAWLHQPYETLHHLTLSPDGRYAAFNLERDSWTRRGPNPYGGSEIWLVTNEAGGSDFRRLSDYLGRNLWPLWNQDGSGLYFISDRDSIENVWFQPLDGAEARQVTTFRDGRTLWPTLSADGRTMIFERDFQLWRLDLPSGESAPLTIHVRADSKIVPVQVFTYTRGTEELALAPDGKKLAFTVRGEVFADFADKETDKERRNGPSFRVTNTPAREQQIAWSPDSRQIVYTSDRHGDEEVYRYDFGERSETRLTDSSGPKGQPSYSPDGKWIAYQCGDQQIRLIATADGSDQGFVQTEFINGGFAWSPDSQWLVFVAQDARQFSNLYVQRLGETQARQVSFLGNLYVGGPIWAANGQFIIFSTHQYRSESQIARLDLRPQAPQFREEEFERLFEQRQAPNEQRTAPAPSTPPTEEKVEPVASNQPQETPAEKDKAANVQQPAASASDQRAVQIVFEGIERRLRFLTPLQMDARAQAISPDSRDLIFSASVADKRNIWSLPLDEPRAEQPPRQLTGGTGYKSDAQFAPDGRSFFFLDGGQIVMRKFPSGDQTSIAISADVRIDFHREKWQIFNECWRLLRDRFFDPTFRGLNWDEVHAQFSPLVAGTQNSDDLHTIISLMVGELRASHLGISGWGSQQLQGYVGLLFDPVEQARSGRLMVSAIVPDSPIALAGNGQPVSAGDRLLAVNGISLDDGSNLDAQLQRTIGQRVVLRFERSTDGQTSSYELAVRPISFWRYNQLRYRAWVQANELYVNRISDGRLGYVHIRSMDYPSYQQFLVDLDAETHSKEGVVVDVRFNGGGHTGTFILDVLTRQSILLSTFRDRPAADAGHAMGNRVLNKPTVLVVNERCASNTEMLIEDYRRLALGKVVGRPTAGAVIGTIKHTLLNGAPFRIPFSRIATTEGEDLEGTGRPVDIDVALPLGEWVNGQDRQLETAVSSLLSDIDRQRKREARRQRAKKPKAPSKE